MLRYDHYKLLGISRDASQAQIKRAFRERVKNCHPDLNPSPRAAAVFRAVHEAYRILSNSRQRSMYDEQLRYYRHVEAPSVEARDLHRKYGQSKRQAEHHASVETPPGPVDRFAFVGLHLTGLIFGLALVSGILFGITFHDWPPATLIFSMLGLAVLPDSWEGLRTRALRS